MDLLARDEAIFTAWMDGATMEAASLPDDLSRERARQIVREQARRQRDQLRGAVEENEKLRDLWRDGTLIDALYQAHTRGDVSAALRRALGGQ